MRPHFLWFGLCALVSAALLAEQATAAQRVPPRPNILFIMSDDHAAHAISSYGSKINQTPNLDRIAATGMRFRNCFVNNSICTPSRAAILTGKYSHLNGVTVFNKFDGSQPHVAKYLQQAGYQTAVIGKWHLFSDPTGFDYWNVLPGQGKYHDPEMIEMGQTNTLQGYATDIITDLSIEWLKKRDPKKPFFLCTQHKAPHREWSPDKRHAKLFEDEDIPAPVTFNDDYRGRSRAAAEATMRVARDFKKTDLKQDPPKGLEGDALKWWNYQRYIKDYLRCVASIDENVGRLLDYLESTGLRTNTLVIYTSDQGFFLGEHGWYDKRFMYEESLRMPLLVSWAGRIKPGTVNEMMVLNVDFAPTFMELAGIAVPADMQGRSLVPLLRGKKPRDWRTSMYYRYYHYPGDHQVQPHLGVRTERHKLIHFNKLDAWELYDLKRDPHETNNLYSDPKQTNRLKKLKSELGRLKKELKDEDQFADGPTNQVELVPVSSELVLRYDFAGSNGDRVADASGKGHDAKAYAAEIVTGRTHRALKLTGQGHITIEPSNKAPDPAKKPFAVGAWCRPESGEGVLVAHGGASHGFTLYLQNSVPHFVIRSEGELFQVVTGEKVVPGEWVHLLGVLDTNRTMRLFINGHLAGFSPGAPVAAKPKDGLVVGADLSSPVGNYQTPFNFRGLIEDVRLYWGGLSGEEQQRWIDQ